MDENSDWPCTQAVVCIDDDGDDRRPGDEKIVNRFGCIVLDIEADSDCYVLKEGDNTIGRHPINSIYIEHPSVSMNHAVIQCDSDGVVLIDKGSLNKTRLNKKNLKKEIAYFLDENASLMFGEVQANYYVDKKPNTIVYAYNNLTKQKTLENDEVARLKRSNKLITSNYSTEQITKYNALLDNRNNFTCKMETKIPETVIKPDSINNISNDVQRKLNSSSPIDELLLEALSQVETMENDINPSRIIHNISREDTHSPAMVLNELSDKVNSDLGREDTPSPLMCLGSLLSDKLLNPSKIPTNVLPPPNKIDTETIQEDTPSPVMDLELFGHSGNRLYISETNNHCQNSASECANGVDFDEIQVLEVNSNIVDTTTHSQLITNICITNSTISKPTTSFINLSNTDDNNSLDECTQLPVWDHKDMPPNKKDNLSISVNINDKLLKKDLQNSNAPSVKILSNQSNNDNFYDCPTQKLKLSNSGMFEANSSFISCTSKTNNFKLNELETQTINSDDNSSHKLLISKVVRNSVSKNEKLSDSIFEVNDDVLLCVAQEVESSEQSDKNAIKISSVKQLSDLQHSKHNTHNLVKSKDSFCDKENLYNDCNFYRLSQNESILKSSHTKSESDVHEQSSLKKNINTFEADDDDIFSSFIQQESESKVHVLNSLNDEHVFNCSTQTKSSLNKVNLNNIASSTIYEKETQQILENSQSTTNSSQTSMLDDVNQLSKIDDFFNCPTQKISFSKKINPKISSIVHEQESKPLNPSKQITCEPKACNFQTKEVVTHGKDFFNCLTQKASMSETINLKTNAFFAGYEEEIQPFCSFNSGNKTDTSTSNITQVSKMNDNDIFNHPTQNLLISKDMHLKESISCAKNDESEEIPKLVENSIKSMSKEYVTPINDVKKKDDFFNCSTQKILVPKNTNSLTKLLSKIHNEETQNLSISKNINSKVLSTIHEEETQLQIPSNSKSKDNISASKLKTCALSVNEKLLRSLERDNEDFFNCPTQKVSICKEFNANVSATIHEKETQLPVHSCSKPIDEIQTNKLNTSAASVNRKPLQNPEQDDDEDFFNCPTQKLTISSKVNSKVISSIHEKHLPQLSLQSYLKPKVPSKINEKETLPECLLLGKTNEKTYNICISSTQRDLIQASEINDEDFFNCPTQKPFILKKINLKENESSTICKKETKKVSKLPVLNKTNLGTFSIHKNLTQNTRIEDEDFFNCPTQKILNSKKINCKVSSIIHEKGTQLPVQSYSKPTDKKQIKTLSTYADSFNRKPPQNSEQDNEDFFNCSTQKLSISKNINSKVLSTIHEEETQLQIPSNSKSKDKISASKLKTCDASVNEKPLQSAEMDNEDFFNCPTQKVSICKEINANVSATIHKKETQLSVQSYSKPIDKIQTNKLNTYAASVNKKPLQNPEQDDDEDFFNCPTQKLTISSKVNSKVFSSVHKKETKLPVQSYSKSNVSSTINENTFNTCFSGTQSDLIQAPEINDEDFFNCPTQKLSNSKKINSKVSSTIHDEETQLPSKPNIDTFKTCSMRILEDLTQILTTNDEDFFDCSSQKVSTTKKKINCKSNFFN